MNFNLSDVFDALPDGDKSIASGKGICDFCSPPQPSIWIYPCKTFRLPMPPGSAGMLGKKHYPSSEGDWGACETCAALIEANDREGLVARCGHTHPMVIDLQTKVIDLFYRKRTGEARISVDGQESEFYGGVLVVEPDDKS